MTGWNYFIRNIERMEDMMSADSVHNFLLLPYFVGSKKRYFKTLHV